MPSVIHVIDGYMKAHASQRLHYNTRTAYFNWAINHVCYEWQSYQTYIQQQQKYVSNCATIRTRTSTMDKKYESYVRCALLPLYLHVVCPNASRRTVSPRNIVFLIEDWRAFDRHSNPRILHTSRMLIATKNSAKWLNGLLASFI